jgi:hypothetical protein
VRVVAAHHAPGRFRGDEGRPRRKTARLLDARPEQPQRAELRHGQELLGISGEAEKEEAARAFGAHAARLERPQVGDRRGECESEFLYLGPAGRMHEATVGRRERTAEAFPVKRGDESGKKGVKILPGEGTRP